MNHNLKTISFYRVQAGLELNFVAHTDNTPALVSWVLVFQACATTPQRSVSFEYKKMYPVIMSVKTEDRRPP